jgi:hypothetical protein
MSLNLPEHQLLAHYEYDHVPGHHRVLLEKIHGSTYILATPDRRSRAQDIALLTLRPVVKNPAFPYVDGATYSFDRDLLEENLADLVAEAHMLREIMGADLAAASLEAGLEAAWRVADPADESFGNLVRATGYTCPGRTIVRGSLALAKIDGAWTFTERGAVPPTGIETSGNKRVPYHTHGVRINGIPLHAGFAIEHGVPFTILALVFCFGLLDASDFVSAERTARHILMIGRAAKRSPRAPDFEGLDVFLSDQFHSTEGAPTPNSDRSLSKVPKKNDATDLKRQQPYHEGSAADIQRKKGKYGPRDKGGGAE